MGGELGGMRHARRQVGHVLVVGAQVKETEAAWREQLQSTKSLADRATNDKQRLAAEVTLAAMQVSRGCHQVGGAGAYRSVGTARLTQLVLHAWCVQPARALALCDAGARPAGRAHVHP